MSRCWLNATAGLRLKPAAGRVGGCFLFHRRITQSTQNALIQSCQLLNSRWSPSNLIKPSADCTLQPVDAGLSRQKIKWPLFTEVSLFSFDFTGQRLLLPSSAGWDRATTRTMFAVAHRTGLSFIRFHSLCPSSYE